jgi:hypothetical protein
MDEVYDLADQYNELKTDRQKVYFLSNAKAKLHSTSYYKLLEVVGIDWRKMRNYNKYQ